MLDLSIDSLEKYLAKKRRTPLPIKHIKDIKNLIAQRQKENSKFATMMLNSPLCKLATAEVIREGKATVMKCHNELRYDLNVNLVLRKMYDLINALNKPQNRKLYKEYLNG